MKVLIMVVALLAFLVDAIGDGWTTPVVESLPYKETAETIESAEVQRMSVVSPTRNSPRLAGTVGGLLPTELHLGSLRRARNFMVATNGLAAMVTVGLEVYPTSTSTFSTKTQRQFVGFGSFEEFVEDSRLGMNLVLNKFRTNVLSPDIVVHAKLAIMYFSDDPESTNYRTALSMINPICSFRDLTLDKAMSVIGAEAPSLSEIMVVPVPELVSVSMQVLVDANTMATMDWTPETGPRLSSWKEPKEFTTSYYLYIRPWVVTNADYVRINLRSRSGEVKTYTQWGGAIVPPTLTLNRDGTVNVSATRGSDVAIEASQDLRVWSYQTTLTNVADKSSVKVLNLDLPAAFLRGVSF